MTVRCAAVLVIFFAANVARGENPHGAGEDDGELRVVIKQLQVEERDVRDFGPVEAPPWQPVPAPVPLPPAVVLPGDAQKLVTAFNQQAADIRKKADQEIAASQQKLIEELTKLRDAYSKPGTLDEAVAIRDRIRQLKAGVQGADIDAQPDPGSPNALRGQLGKVFHFRVTGSANGFVWGTGIYTDDSRIATAAVHAGILRDGQQGVVKVTILPGQPNYAGSANNGVTSQPYPNFGGSYLIESP